MPRTGTTLALAALLITACKHPAPTPTPVVPQAVEPEPDREPEFVCVVDQRMLEPDETLEKWPTPNEFAAAADGVYAGSIQWTDPRKDWPSHIEVEVIVPVERFFAREIIRVRPEEAQGKDQRPCLSSSLIVRMDFDVWWADNVFRLEGSDVLLGGRPSVGGSQGIHLSVTEKLAPEAPPDLRFGAGVSVVRPGELVGSFTDRNGRRVGAFRLKRKPTL